ncbi:MAG: NAD+ synthase [Anaerolineae bacterium]|nr:NAD+ synthase [Anaerolineae bacterium]MDW8070576.1 NAD+ synthase [Anaerolineae bacterium]
MKTLRIVLAQINATVGDLPGNRAKIAARIEQARRLGADIVVFPEMGLTGYPPEDLLLKPDFIEAAHTALLDLAPASRGMTVIVGTAYADGDLHNAAAVLHDGRLAGVYYKHYLPNYGVFDEERYFEAGRQRLIFVRNGIPIGISVCEDIWYPDGPPEAQALEGGAELLINISASPYYRGRGQTRERMLRTRAADNTAFLAYCNLVGGQDELVFDGHSLICGPQGELLARGKQFAEDMVVADLDMRQVFRSRLYDPRRRKHAHADLLPFERVVLPPIQAPTERAPLVAQVAPLYEPAAEVYTALVLGTRDYVLKNGFHKVVLGLSGGVDSSLTAAIATDALGPENVVGVAMPTRYSSPHSLEDAQQLARNFGFQLLTIPIDDTFQSFLDVLAPIFAGLPADVTEENLQPRIRGTLLMALSNKFGWLVLTTGNKSEVGVGYSTLYGDTAGGFAVIKDVPKMLVYELCRYRNELAGYDIIPRRVLEKAPSAELRPNQKDTDSLPEYAILDPILHAYVEEGCGPAEIVARGYDPETVRQVIRMVDRSEYKRRQSPPGVKITPRAFGKDWRLPITNRYRPESG